MFLITAVKVFYSAGVRSAKEEKEIEKNNYKGLIEKRDRVAETDEYVCV